MSKDSKSAAAFAISARLKAEHCSKRAADASISAMQALARAAKAQQRLAGRGAARRTLTPER